MDMINPTDDEVEDVAAISGISEDMLASALDDEERARAEIDDGNYMFILDCPVIEEGDSGDVYSTLPLAVIYNSKCVVTVSLKGNPVLKDFITGRQKVLTEKPVLFTLNFMLGNAKRFLNVLTQIDRKSRRVQAELGRTMKNEEIAQLLDLENSLVYISTSLNSNYSVQEKLSKAEAVTTREDYQDLYDDVAIESKQAMEMCNIYKDILTVDDGRLRLDDLQQRQRQHEKTDRNHRASRHTHNDSGLLGHERRGARPDRRRRLVVCVVLDNTRRNARFNGSRGNIPRQVHALGRRDKTHKTCKAP